MRGIRALARSVLSMNRQIATIVDSHSLVVTSNRMNGDTCIRYIHAKSGSGAHIRDSRVHQANTIRQMLGVGSVGAAAAFLYSSTSITAEASPQPPPAEASPQPPPAEASPITTEKNPYRVQDFVPVGRLPSSITVYQYEVCPFCCKVKAYLDYHNLPYRVVEVNPLTKAEITWSDYKKVPVVVIDETTQLNNSSSIISQLESEIRMVQPEKSNPSGSWLLGKARSKAHKAPEDNEAQWRQWVDEKFVKAITVNIYRNAKEAFQTFDYITEHGNFGWVQRQAARIVGATMMWGLSNRLKKKYGIEGDVRDALYALADEWVDALGKSPFMGGLEPNLADIETFGVIRSVVGTDTFMDLQHNTRIAAWYERMMKVVGDSSRIRE